MEPPVARQTLATRRYAEAISMECEIDHTWTRFSSEGGWSRHVRPTRHSPLWGMKTRSHGQGRTAGVGFESGPLLLMIDERGF